MRVPPGDRENTISALRGGYIAGLLSLETLEQRAAAAFSARHPHELGSLTEDLPPKSLLARVARWLGGPRGRVLQAHAVVQVAPPPDTEHALAWSIGRGARSNLRIRHDTVSRRHAELVRHEDAWLLRDCGSTNGTQVNGWRIEEALIRQGDVITLGDVSIVIT